MHSSPRFGFSMRLRPARLGLVLAMPVLLAACGTAREQATVDTAAVAAADSLPSTEGMIDVPGGRVWYRRIGNGPGTPILALHGGPGGTSCRFEVLAPLARERPVIFYDQLGSGRSDHPSDTSLWNVSRFVAELAAVRKALNLERVHVLGHSWGRVGGGVYGRGQARRSGESRSEQPAYRHAAVDCRCRYASCGVAASHSFRARRRGAQGHTRLAGIYGCHRLVLRAPREPVAHGQCSALRGRSLERHDLSTDVGPHGSS